MVGGLSLMFACYSCQLGCPANHAGGDAQRPGRLLQRLVWSWTLQVQCVETRG